MLIEYVAFEFGVEYPLEQSLGNRDSSTSLVHCPTHCVSNALLQKTYD